MALGALTAPAQCAVPVAMRSCSACPTSAMSGCAGPGERPASLSGALAQLKLWGPQGGPDGHQGATAPPIQVAHPAAPFPTLQSPHRLPAMCPWDTRAEMAQPGDDSPAKELQQPPPVSADLLAPGVSPGSAGEERPPAQLLLEDGPERGLGTQHLDATHTCVNATLQERGTLSSSAQPQRPTLLLPGPAPAPLPAGTASPGSG